MCKHEYFASALFFMGYVSGNLGVLVGAEQ